MLSSVNSLSFKPISFHKAQACKEKKKWVKEVSRKVLWACLFCSLKKKKKAETTCRWRLQFQDCFITVLCKWQIYISDCAFQFLPLLTKSFLSAELLCCLHELVFSVLPDLCSAQCKQALGSSVNRLFLIIAIKGTYPQRQCWQSGLSPSNLSCNDQCISWVPEGRSVCSRMTAVSLSVPSPVLCLPSRLSMQLFWKNLWWQSCILWAMHSITHLAIGLTLQGREKIELLSIDPAGWPWNAISAAFKCGGGSFYLQSYMFQMKLSLICFTWSSSVYSFAISACVRLCVNCPLVPVALCLAFLLALAFPCSSFGLFASNSELSELQ